MIFKRILNKMNCNTIKKILKSKRNKRNTYYDHMKECQLQSQFDNKT